MFEETGCKDCQNAWMNGNRENILVPRGKDNYERQARVQQCSSCGAYWEEPNGAYPSGLSEQEAKSYYNV